MDAVNELKRSTPDRPPEYVHADALPEYVHLKDVRFLGRSETGIHPYWRVRSSDVSGWTLGEVAKAE